ncbi:uncharacterized protein LOC131169317 [Hevea brasiliensis]|uniref:uncharacterized protein LOC131169317 n=1 Tax=Hevea brasiliensis TaxID=3981 RepID=UPI0025EED2A5|nr:uncharacterized protein LOC131169317 [Hevea brasiliensis]
MRIVERIQQGEDCEFGFAADGALMQGSRICVPDVDNLRAEIMQEAHYTPYNVHPSSTKMYHDTDEQSERIIQTLEDMLRMCILDFGGPWDDKLPLVKFAYNNSYHSSIKMAPYEALYGKKFRSPLCWIEVGEAKVHDLDLAQHTSEMVLRIREHLKTTFSRQKSYTYPRWRDVEFVVGDFVFLKVSPMKGVMRFGKNGKLASRYIGPFEITNRVGPVAYRLYNLRSLQQYSDRHSCRVIVYKGRYNNTVVIIRVE